MPLSLFSVCMLKLLKVKIRGQRIELGEIEAKMLQHQARGYTEQGLAWKISSVSMYESMHGPWSMQALERGVANPSFHPAMT